MRDNPLSSSTRARDCSVSGGAFLARAHPGLVELTAKRLGILAQGGGFAEPWVPEVKTDSSEGARESVRNSESYQHTSDHSRTTATFCDLDLYRSFRAVHLMTFNTQGSAKPPPWAKFSYAFGVYAVWLPKSPVWVLFRESFALFHSLDQRHQSQTGLSGTVLAARLQQSFAHVHGHPPDAAPICHLCYFANDNWERLEFVARPSTWICHGQFPGGASAAPPFVGGCSCQTCRPHLSFVIQQA
jgi:hypothetical protein